MPAAKAPKSGRAGATGKCRGITRQAERTKCGKNGQRAAADVAWLNPGPPGLTPTPAKLIPTPHPNPAPTPVHPSSHSPTPLTQTHPWPLPPPPAPS
ncbi:unnamed protein product [Gadus morhua 'NCC']